jgi:hypothetical protein
MSNQALRTTHISPDSGAVQAKRVGAGHPVRCDQR